MADIGCDGAKYPFFNHCSICFDPPKTCKSHINRTGSVADDSKCRDCEHEQSCSRTLRPTIRLTTKCNRSCGHCCFNCSPDNNKFMSVDTAKQVTEFINNNGVRGINVMGGEIYLNPDYKEILPTLLSPPLNREIRIVTNGDFDEDFISFVANEIPNVKLVISNDQWHRPSDPERMLKLLRKYSVPCMIDGVDATTGETDNRGLNENGIVPIGRGELAGEFSFYSMFGCYCRNPNHRYTFLIDEDGDVFRCPMGALWIANIYDFPGTEFLETFRQIAEGHFYESVMNCKHCIRSFSKHYKPAGGIPILTGGNGQDAHKSAT